MSKKKTTPPAATEQKKEETVAPLKSFCFPDKGVTIKASSISEAREILKKQEETQEKK